MLLVYLSQSSIVPSIHVPVPVTLSWPLSPVFLSWPLYTHPVPSLLLLIPCSWSWSPVSLSENSVFVLVPCVLVTPCLYTGPSASVSLSQFPMSWS